jgi:hypothetical protein
MAYKKKELMLSDKELLLQVIDELQSKLKKKSMELYRVRAKLTASRRQVMKMKDTVMFQRKRILELYN